VGGKTKNLTGQKFGYLTVIECVGKDKWGKRLESDVVNVIKCY